MAFLNIKDTRLSTWLTKYNASQKKVFEEAKKAVGNTNGLINVSAGSIVDSWNNPVIGNSLQAGNKNYIPIDLPSEYLPLQVIQSSGVEVNPNMKVNVTDLNRAKGILYKNFQNNSDLSITFKVDVIIRKNEMWECELYSMYKQRNDIKKWYVTTILKEWARNSVPLYIATNAIDVPNGNYIITDNPSRKQTYKDTTVWTLEFTTFNPLNLTVYKNNNINIQNILKKKKTVKAKSTNAGKLKKCKLSVLKYSKTRRNIACVKYMQQLLYKKGFLKGGSSQIDGWYGNNTKLAVKKFQVKYAKLYKLKATGIVDKKTYDAMCRM